MIFTSLSLLAAGTLTGSAPFQARPYATVARVGKYQVELRVPENGLVAGETVDVEFRLSDTTQNDAIEGKKGVPNAAPRATVTMPAMPGMPVVKPTIHSEGVPGDYGIETVNGMAWLVRAAEADETVKRRKDEEVVLHIQRLMPVEAMRLRGRHNATNALAALALAGAAGGTLASMLHGLRDYAGEPHRVTPVAVINDVEYFDDSKGTNVGATVAALTGLGAERKLVLIAGGDGKGQDFSPLADPVRSYARAVILIGRDAPRIRAVLEGAGVVLFDAGSMQAAVELASAQAHTGDAVLMSPACASFDMFDNYEHRAQVFCEAVQGLARDAGGVS